MSFPTPSVACHNGRKHVAGRAVVAMHGTVDAINPTWISHRNFLPRSQFEAHLRSRSEPYVDLKSALNGGGDALTIDDATGGAYDAAVIAREHGHAVTLFVNPSNVIAQTTHFFALLALVLDQTSRTDVTFLGQDFELKEYEGKFAFRQTVKGKLLSLSREEDRFEIVRQLAEALRVSGPSVPRFFQTLDTDNLRALKAIGVEIGNHGWTHGAVETLTPAAAQDNMRSARRWIGEVLGGDAAAYAVPFGNTLPTFDVDAGLCDVWLLNDSSIPAGYLSDKVYNRPTLKLPLLP